MPSIEGGGVEKNFFIISNYLSYKIKEISVITVSKKYKKNFNKKINFISPSFDFFDKLGRRKKYFISLYLLFLEFLKNKNIFVFCFQANIYCTILCKMLGIKIVVRSNSSPSGWSQNIFKRKIFEYFLNVADQVIVNSIEFKKELKLKFNVKSICIYNPLNINEIIKLSKKNISFKFFKKNTLNLINVGRLVDQKDQLTLLKSTILLRQNKVRFRLLLVGSGILKNNLKKFIKENYLESQIKIINFQKNPFPYILKADIFILSSIYEGLPNVLLEATALKKYIISSNCPTGPKEILDNGMGGELFKMKDFTTLAKKITLYRKNSSLCKKKIKHANLRLKRFNYEKNLNKYYKIINNFLNENL